MTYVEEVLKDNPLGYWRLNETSGTTATDITGHGYNGTYAGSGVSYRQATPVTQDSSAAAVTLDNVNGTVTLPSSINIAAGGQITVEYWIKNVTVVQNYGFSIGPVATERCSTHSPWVDNTLYWDYGNIGNTGARLTANFAPYVGQWVHVVVLYDGSQNRIYINGIQVAAAANPSPPTAARTGGSWINGASGGTLGNSNFAEFALYNTALSAQRIMAHYNAAAVSYANTVLADGPVGYWRLQEPGPGLSTADATGHGYTGTYTGTMTTRLLGPIRTDPGDASISLNGTNAYVSVADNAAFALTTAVTLEVWIRATSWPAAVADLVNRRKTDGSTGGYTLQAGSNGTFNMYVYTTNWFAVSTPTPTTLYVWHHVVGTYDGANLRVYLDGVLQASSALTGAIANPSPAGISFGAEVASPAAYFFTGYMDEVAIYNYALSAARVRAHFNAASAYATAVLADAPTGYWRLGETSGTTAVDASGNGRDGTFQNSPSGNAAGAIVSEATPQTGVGFNGTNNYISLPSIAIANTSFSVEAWIKPTDFAADRCWFGASTTGAQDQMLHLRVVATTGKMLFGYYNDDLPGVASLPVGVWSHVVCTYDAVSDTSRIYINGALDASGSQGPFIGASPIMTIGYVNGMGQYFLGTIDEVAIYDKALPPSHVRMHYALGGGPYQAVVLDDRPVGYWRFNGNGADSSVNNNPGTATGAGAWQLPPGAIINEPNWSFNANGVAYFTMNEIAAYAFTTACSAEGWILPTQLTTGTVINRRTTGNVGGFSLEFTNDGTNHTFQWHVYTDTWHSLGFTGPPGLNQWYHVAGTWDGATQRLYFNGAVVASQALTGTMNNPASPFTRIGQNIAGTQCPFAVIDEVALYNTGLTPARIQAHFLAGTYSPYRAAVFNDLPVAYWRLAELAGTTAVDNTGKGHTGTWSGTFTPASAGVLGSGALGNDFDGAPTLNVGRATVADFVDLRPAGGGWTMEAWVKPTTVSNIQDYIRKDGAGAGYFIRQSGSSFVSLFAVTGSAYNSPTGGTITAGVWQHVVATYDGANIRHYINGALVLTTPETRAFAPNNATTILGAQASTGGEDLIGQLDEPALYPSALSLARVQAHYAAASPVVYNEATDVFELTPNEPRIYWDSTAGVFALGSKGVTALWNKATGAFNV